MLQVGGVDRKWEYLIDGPVMAQVRSADEDAKAGQVALSQEAYDLIKSVDMRKKVLKTGNVRLYTYHGPQKETKFVLYRLMPDPSYPPCTRRCCVCCFRLLFTRT